MKARNGWKYSECKWILLVGLPLLTSRISYPTQRQFLVLTDAEHSRQEDEDQRMHLGYRRAVAGLARSEFLSGHWPSHGQKKFNDRQILQWCWIIPLFPIPVALDYFTLKTIYTLKTAEEPKPQRTCVFVSYSYQC